MKATDLHTGEEYAYSYSRRNKVETPLFDVERVKVISVQKYRPSYHGERGYTTATVQFLDFETGEPNGRPNNTVRARDFIDFWDDYYDRFLNLKEEMEQQQSLAQRVREAEARKEERIIRGLIEKGIPQEVISAVTMFDVELSRTKVERWLGIAEEEKVI